MMYRRPEEIAELKESFRRMDVPHKIEYIYTYYKWFILLGLVALVILSNTVYRQVTKKDVPLYVGFANVVVGPELEQTMTTDFLEQLELPLKKNEVLLYKGLYLSHDPAPEDHQYAYASSMKVMAAVNAKKLDAVLMNQEAYDLLSQDGYLMELSDMPASLAPYLTENEVILESNAVDVNLNIETEYRVVTESVVNGVDVSSFSCFQDAGFDGAIYFGIFPNTLHADTAVQYLEYLLTK